MRSSARLIRRGAALAAALLLPAAPAGAQLFLASRPDPAFTVGPLMIRASVAETAGPVTVQVLWSLDVPSGARAGAAQDLYLLWPGEVQPGTAGPGDAALARYVEERGFAVVGEGRVVLASQPLSDGPGARPEPVPGGAPFVVFVQEGGALGLSPPATLVRLPWADRMADRAWLMDLRLPVPGLVKARQGTWAERLFVGGRYLVSVSWSEVRDRPLFPMYLHHRDRVVRLSEAPAELAVDFARSERLKIDQVFPPTSIRRLSENREQTEVVSLFLDRTDGISPQYLSVQFGYFSPAQAWALVLVPALFFVLGHAVGPVLGRAALKAGDALAARVDWGGRGGSRRRESGVMLAPELLARIAPGRTTRDELLALCGPPSEEREQLAAPGRRTLVYRGRRVAPAPRRVFGWLATVAHWEVEHREVRVRLAGDVVEDLEAETRYCRLGPDGAPGRTQ